MKKVFLVLVIASALIGLSSAAFANCGVCSSGNKADVCSKCLSKSLDQATKCADSCKVTHRESKHHHHGTASNDYTKGLPQVAGEIEKTGIVEVSFYGNYNKIDKVVLRSGDEAIRLIHSAKHSMRHIEKMNGKVVVVRGKVCPVSRKHPEEAFEVIHISEVQ